MINELRIGNWIKVDDLPEEQVTLETFATLSQHPNTLSLFKPMPLTEERLVKFGFFRHEKGCTEQTIMYTSSLYGGPTIEFAISEDGSLIVLAFTVMYAGIHGDMETTIELLQYVHQLQNTYYTFTGEELQYNGN